MEFKIKSQIRRVFSDRVLKVAKSSVTKIQQETQQQQQLDTSLPLAGTPKIAAKFTSQLSNSAQKMVLQPIKTTDIKDKEALVNHVKRIYDETVNSDGSSLVFAIQSIGNSVLHFIKSPNNNGQIVRYH